ncbi:DNA replication protein [Atopostipes suicloacalis DSM 15692]|uniref:DNA replication protein n=1 Tax=Atopostipes suicloacalis DSM 15692 TaxID=1121025 RepID=A0A1M4USS3_9LACT|nr:DnaD domain-containing protein [Atopostipes suicloacalis]SHE59791.1 DNA replication protein [Atopostipes suicloacalis DSM 15692]
MENELTIDWINAGQTVLPTLLLRYYRRLNLSNDELVLILQLKSYMDQGNYFPKMEDIAEHMNMTEQNVFKAVHQLIQKKVLTIETTNDEQGMSQDAYSLNMLWERIIILMKQEKSDQAIEKEEIEEKNLYSMFESEFGRPLSPIEIETLVAWIENDRYSPELIQLALREAVLSQVYNFKYIDRILLNWEKKNIRTKEQVDKEIKKYRDAPKTNDIKDEDQQDSGPVPMINWLKDNNDNN